MYDVTIVGGGRVAHSCYDALSHAGLKVTRTFELDAGDPSPVILGDSHAAYPIARQALEEGRHLLIADTQALSPERLSLLLEGRRRSQAVFVWSERRYHPGYHLLAGLVESDATWRPRFLRAETLSMEASNALLFRLRALEAIGLVVGIAGAEPLEVAARASSNPKRNSVDLLNLEIAFPDLQAFLQVGMGEALERRETLLAATTRKALVDELDARTPVRLVDSDPGAEPRGRARWLACPAPSAAELARQQCFAFLAAALDSKLAEQEAALWRSSLDVIGAMQRSLASAGAAVPLHEPSSAGSRSALRLILPDAA